MTAFLDAHVRHKTTGISVPQGRYYAILACVFCLFFLLLSPELYANQWRAVRRGSSSNTLRDPRIGGRVGGGLTYLQTGSERKFSRPYLGYQYGVEMLIPVEDFFELDVSGLANWKGGQLSSVFADAGGQGIDVATQIRILSLRLGLFGNYVYRIPHNWDIFAGIGMIPQIQVAGRMKLDLPDGTQSYDLDVGFDSKSHLYPINFGLGAQAGVRFLSTFSLSVWYEYDFLNLIPEQKRFYGNTSPSLLLRTDFSRPFVQSLGRISTQALGISFVYYISL